MSGAAYGAEHGAKHGAQRRVVVTGVGLISPLGESLADLHAALCRGESALAEVESFERDGLPSRLGAAAAGFAEARHFGNRNFRPLDRTGRLAAAASGLALADAGWPATEREAVFADGRSGVELGLVLGTTFGSVHTISEFDRRALTAGPNYVKPLDFANSVINAAAGQTAIWHDLRGVNSTLSGGPTVGLTAIAYAADLVATGRAEVLLAGGAEELCYESFLGYARSGRTAGAGGGGGAPCAVPFDERRNGFAPGEGAALLVLEDEEVAAARGARVLAVVAGHGAAFDPSRGRDEDSATAAVARAVAAALAAAGVAAGDLGAVSASASGSPAGDRREARGLAAALGAAAGSLPVTALKGALGEPLGAGGAFQAACLVATLGDGRLPGIAGLGEAEEGLGLGGLSPESRRVDRPWFLASALDHDGNAAALVLARRAGS